MDTASICENEPESTECSNLASNEFCPSLSQAVATSFSREFIEFEENSTEVLSFLSERKLIDEYSAEQNISNLINKNTIDKICFNSSNSNEEGI